MNRSREHLAHSRPSAHWLSLAASKSSNAFCRSSGGNASINSLILPWPLRALGLMVCEKQIFITNVWPHSTFEQLQYTSDNFGCFRFVFLTAATDAHSGHTIFSTRISIPLLPARKRDFGSLPLVLNV